MRLQEDAAERKTAVARKVHLEEVTEAEKPVAVGSTLAVSLSDSLGLVAVAVAAMPRAAAAPAAGGTVAGTLTWETGAVYKHAAK